jgi:hypothetical protein
VVEHLPTSDERWAELGPRLVVVVRPAIYEGAYAAALVRAPIAPLLYVYAAVDDGDSLRLLRADEAGSLAASHAEVLAAGIRNLEERGARLLGPEQSNEGREVLLVESGDGLESSHHRREAGHDRRAPSLPAPSRSPTSGNTRRSLRCISSCAARAGSRRVRGLPPRGRGPHEVMQLADDRR